MIQTAEPHPGATPVLVTSLRCCQLSWICQHFVLVSYSLNEQTCNWLVTSSNLGWGKRNPDIDILYLFPSAQVNSISKWSTNLPKESSLQILGAIKQNASWGHKGNVNLIVIWHLLLGAYELIHSFMSEKKLCYCVIYARSIRRLSTTFEGQTALLCVQILDKLRHIYCMWHHKVAMLLLWYSSLCVMFSNIDFKTFLIKQFHKHNHFWCSNIVKQSAISKSSTFHLPEDGGSWFLQTIGN